VQPSTESQVPPTEGRRTQLKIVREGIDSLTTDVWNLRRKHESSIKKLEGQVASLKEELSRHPKTKDLEAQTKTHQAANKRLEKQVVTLRTELAAMKSSMTKDAAKARAKQEATLAKILAKVSKKPAPGKK